MREQRYDALRRELHAQRELRDELAEWLKRNTSSPLFEAQQRAYNLAAGRCNTLSQRATNIRTGAPELGDPVGAYVRIPKSTNRPPIS